MVGVTGSIPVAPTTHSRFLPTSGDAPKMPTNGGPFQCVPLVSRSPQGQTADFSPQSLRQKIPFLAPKSCGGGSFAESGLGQTKPLKLQRPFGRRITQVGDADAARKPSFDGGLDQTRRDECHRYRHVDLTNAALLARGNGFDAGSARDDLVEPGTSARDGFDQCRTSLRLPWPRAGSCGLGW